MTGHLRVPQPRRVILASASPRRLELLARIGVAPEAVDPADIDESVRPRERPEPHVARLAAEKAAGWAQTKVLAVDGLRFMRNPPAGELLRGRMTVMGKDPVGDEKGIVIAQHDLLDEGGRLVFSCLTRALFTRR